MPLRASDQYNNSKVEPWLVAGARELTQTKETKKQGAPGKPGSKISCKQSTRQRQEVGWRAARKIGGRGALQALRPAATEEVFCSKLNLGPREKKAGPRKIDAEPENQQVQAHEKTLLAKEKNPSGKDSARNLLQELRKSLGREAEGTHTENRSHPRSDSRTEHRMKNGHELSRSATRRRVLAGD
jgi:hypothetical protein